MLACSVLDGSEHYSSGGDGRDEKMRRIEKFELTEGVNKIKIPDLSVVICATDVEGKACVCMEIDTESVEKMEMGFLVSRIGQDIDEKLDIDFLGIAHLVSGEAVLIHEIL